MKLDPEDSPVDFFLAYARMIHTYPRMYHSSAEMSVRYAVTVGLICGHRCVDEREQGRETEAVSYVMLPRATLQLTTVS